jgi:hypothetical protein
MWCDIARYTLGASRLEVLQVLMLFQMLMHMPQLSCTMVKPEYWNKEWNLDRTRPVPPLSLDWGRWSYQCKHVAIIQRTLPLAWFSRCRTCLITC